MKIGRSLLLLLALCAWSVVNAQPTPTPTPTPTVRQVSKYANDRLCSPGCEAGIGDKIVVQVENLSTAVASKEINPTDYVLYLDGQPINGVPAVPVRGATLIPAEASPDVYLLEYELKRTDESRSAWATLLGSPSLLNSRRPVTVSVGLPDKRPLSFTDNSNRPEILLRSYYRRWFIGTSLGVLVAVLLFLYLAWTTNVLRDSNPPQPPAGSKRPYSLALTQAAVWFFLVFGSFLFIGLVTGDYNSITEQALILMGIGTGTALCAAMIDSTKRQNSDTALSTLEPQRAQLEEQVVQLEAKVKSLAGASTAPEQQELADASVQLKETEAKLQDTIQEIEEAKAGLTKPVSDGFFRDLLTDSQGVNLHRFQMLIWTIVLGGLFVIGVYKELAMPAFSGTLLALMGISSGTYLGFKIPEKQG